MEEQMKNQAENANAPENPADGSKVDFKKEAVYPIYAVIMCVGAAIGYTLGTYVFEDLMTWTSIGMGVGIVAALLYSRIRKQ